MKKILIFALFCGLLFSLTSSAFALEKATIEVVFDNDRQKQEQGNQHQSFGTIDKIDINFHVINYQDFQNVLKKERKTWESVGYECSIKDVRRSEAIMHCKKK